MKNKNGDVDKILISFAKIYSQLSFVKSFNRVYQHNDLPNFYAYAAVLGNSNKDTDGHIKEIIRASGISFSSEKLALLKCLGEVLERYSSTVYKNKDFLYKPYKEVMSFAVNPNQFSYFSSSQLSDSKYSMFKHDDNAPFRWINTTELITNKKKYIPTQSVFYNYKFNKEEGKVIVPISTGSAGGKSAKDALIRGILECIERDAFMISYLNKICRRKVSLKSIRNKQVINILEIAEKYRIEVHLFDITSDLNVPTYMSILIDRSGKAPAVLVGAKCDPNDTAAIIGALNESFSVQCWFRELYFDNKSQIKKFDEIKTTDERGLFWFGKENIKKIDFWLKIKEEKIQLKNRQYSENKKLEMLKKLFKNINYPVYFVDIGIPLLKKINYKVIKVVIPDLHPLYLDEQYRYLGSKRLYSVPIKLGFTNKAEEDLNNYPHPFI